MTQAIGPNAFPEDGLNLKDFAQLLCRAAWEAWEQAEKGVDALGGRPPPVYRSYQSTFMSGGLLSSHGSDVTIQHRRAIARADQAGQALQDAVLAATTTGKYTLRGMPKGEHQPVDIWPVLLTNMRIVNLYESIIVVGDRRFEYVRVFLVAPQQAKQSMDRLSRPVCEFAVDAEARKVFFKGGFCIGGKNFELFSALLQNFRNGKTQAANIPFMKSDCLAKKLKFTEQSLRQQVLRLRKEVNERLAVDQGFVFGNDDVIENKPAQGYRISPKLREVARGDLSPPGETVSQP